MHRTRTGRSRSMAIALAAATAMAAQGGVLDSGNTNLILWARADQGTEITAGGVSKWNDLSGHQNHLTQTTPANRPVWSLVSPKAGVRYGLKCDGTKWMTAGAAFTGRVFTVYGMATVTNLDTMNILGTRSGTTAGFGMDNQSSVHRVRGFNGTPANDSINVNNPLLVRGRTYVFGGIIDGVNITARLIDERGVVSTAAKAFAIDPSPQPFTAGRQAGGGGFNLQGDGFEFIVFNKVLNAAEQTLVENYLAAQYATNALASGDYYDGDTPAKGNYDLDVVGIGRVSAGVEVTSARLGGLRLAATGGTLGDGEWLLAGHGELENFRSLDALPVGISQRWSRVWYVDKTGAMDIDLTFDYSESGLPAPPGGTDFELLYSSSNTPTVFTSLGIAESVSGDSVTFSLGHAAMAEGYYTLGSTEPLPAAPAVRTRAYVPGGLYDNHIRTNLLLWLRADAVNGADSSGAPNPQPAPGSALSSWSDLSAFQNHCAEGNANLKPVLITTNIAGGTRWAALYDQDDRVTAGAVFTGRVFSVYGIAASTNLPFYSTVYSTRQETKAGFAFDTGGGSGFMWGFFTNGTYTAVNAGGLVSGHLYGFGGVTDGRFVRVRLLKPDGQIFNAQTGFTNSPSPQAFVAGGKSGYSGGRSVNGRAFEFIVFNKVLTIPERALIENYLSSAYFSSPLAADDLYAGDTPAKGNYDVDVFGIGAYPGEARITTSGAAGFGLAELGIGDTLRPGEWVMAGHNGSTNGYTPITIDGKTWERWTRAWYVDVTGSAECILSFDHSDAGIPFPHGEARYGLLYKQNEGDAWTPLPVTTEPGERVSFVVPSASLKDGYYTLVRLSIQGTVIAIR